MQTDLIARGSSLKAFADGRVGGYLVMFGGQDLYGDYFTPDTDLKWAGAEPRPALYQHGLDNTLAGRELGDGWKKVRTDDVGLWVETQLNLRDEYEEAIHKLATAGKLGLSSGTAAHMIVKEEDGKIARWPVVEGSFTPHPAEPRTWVQPLKAVPLTPLLTLAQPPAAQPQEDASKGAPDGLPAPVPAIAKNIKTVISPSGGFKMNLIEAIKKLVPGLTDEQYGAIEAVLGLAGVAPGAAPEPEAADAEAAEEMMSAGENKPGEKPIRSGDIAAAVAEAVKQLGLQPPAARPPYQFKPAAEPQPAGDALKTVAALRFGETPAAIKAVATDLYGSDYEVKRLKQHQAFGKYARYGKEALDADARRALKTVILTPAQLKAAVIDGVEVSALKAEMSEVVDSLGGFLVPEDVRLDMIERLPGRTTVRSRADVSSTSSDVMTRVKVTGGSDLYTSAMRVTWVGDSPAANAADSVPTFGVEKTPIHIAKITVPVPMALLEDSAFPLSNKLGEWATQAYGLDEDAQFLTGNGIAKPEGILPGQTNLNTRLSQVINGSASAVDADKVIAVQYAIAQQYWDSAVWVMNRATASAVRQLKAGDGHYLWRDGLEAGQPPTLLGFPVELNEAMPGIATNAYPILFGNFYEGYQIADRIGMSLLRDEVTEAEQDIVKFLFRRRLGGQVKGEWAFAVLKMATS